MEEVYTGEVIMFGCGCRKNQLRVFSRSDDGGQN